MSNAPIIKGLGHAFGDTCGGGLPKKGPAYRTYCAAPVFGARKLSYFVTTTLCPFHFW